MTLFFRFDTTKQHRNNETGTKLLCVYLCYLISPETFAKRISKLIGKTGRLKKIAKSGKSSALSEDLAGLVKDN